MEEKQADKIMMRIGPDLKKRADETAKRYGIGTSTLARILLEKFLDTVDEQGSQMIWPPQFNYHISQQTYLKRIHSADEERLDLAADPPAGQRHQDLEADLERRIAAASDKMPQEKRPTG